MQMLLDHHPKPNLQPDLPLILHVTSPLFKPTLSLQLETAPDTCLIISGLREVLCHAVGFQFRGVLLLLNWHKAGRKGLERASLYLQVAFAPNYNNGIPLISPSHKWTFTACLNVGSL